MFSISVSHYKRKSHEKILKKFFEKFFQFFKKRPGGPRLPLLELNGKL